MNSRIKKILLSVLMIMSCILPAAAETAKPKLADIANFGGFTYTYISPTLFKTLDSSVLFSQIGVSFQSKNVELLEVLKSQTQGNNNAMNNRLWKIIKDNHMELMSVQKSNSKVIKWYVEPSGKTGVVKKLLITKRSNSGNAITAIYIEGSLTSADISSILYTF